MPYLLINVSDPSMLLVFRRIEPREFMRVGPRQDNKEVGTPKKDEEIDSIEEVGHRYSLNEFTFLRMASYSLKNFPSEISSQEDPICMAKSSFLMRTSPNLSHSKVKIRRSPSFVSPSARREMNQ